MIYLNRLLFTAAVFAILAGCAADAGTRMDNFSDVQQQIGKLEKRIESLEARQRDMTDLLARARRAVVYIWGTYTFVDKEGHPLRHVVNEIGEPVTDPQGIPLVDVKGKGPIAVTNYCGTAFLAGKGGEMLTNRHIAEPWWQDDDSEPLLSAGLKPAFIRLRAFFQERSGGVPVEVLRVDERYDLALVRTAGWEPTAQPLVLHSSPGIAQEGQAILLVGFPTGLEAILAKLDETESNSLVEETGECSFETAERLSRQKRLRPTLTSGFLWDVLPHVLIYDARTMGGGSGGPIMDWSGRVIGVNFAYLEEFHGGNYGVPIQFGKRLLAGGGLAVREASKESQELLSLYERDREKNITSCTPKN